MPGTSETSQIRDEVLEFCVGKGIDLGVGGDKVVPDCIGFDLLDPYNLVGKDSMDMVGDAQHLEDCEDGMFDYVYSSHLLEDFPHTSKVLKEWVRVLKPGGHLILYLPHERRYRLHCRQTGQPYNQGHSIEDMSLSYILAVSAPLPIKAVKTIERHGAYSFLAVFRKEM